MSKRQLIIAICVLIVFFIVFAVIKNRETIKKGITKVKRYVMKKEHEIFINNLHPKFKNLFIQFINEIIKMGYDVIITSGYRSIEKQNQLHSIDNRNPIGGQSYHNYGLAIDIVLRKGSKLFGKGTKKEDWLATGIPQLADKLQLYWGGNIPGYYDPVHFDVRKIVGKMPSQLLAMGKEQFGTSDTSKIEGNKINIS